MIKRRIYLFMFVITFFYSIYAAISALANPDIMSFSFMRYFISMVLSFILGARLIYLEQNTKTDIDKYKEVQNEQIW